MTCLELQRFAEAEQALETLLAQDHGAFPMARFRLAQAYLAQEKLQAAVIELRRFLQTDPGDFDAHVALATTYLRQGRLEDAAKAFETASSLVPENPDPLYGLGQVYSQQGRPREAAAVSKRAFDHQTSAFDRAIAENPRDAEAYYRMAMAHALAGQLEEAISRFEKALELAPEMTRARLGLDAARRQLGD